MLLVYKIDYQHKLVKRVEHVLNLSSVYLLKLKLKWKMILSLK